MTSPSSSSFPSHFELSPIDQCMTNPSVVHHFHTFIFLKLNDENFLLLKQQVTATLRGLQLMHFLNGTEVPYELLTQNNQTVTKPAYSTYHQQDQLLVA